MNYPIIIIGTGLAGYQLAREFRRLDTTSDLMLITADEGDFYPKPQLSTALTSGKNATTLVTSSAEAMALKLNATLLTHSVVKSIDPIQKAVYIHEEPLFYKKLILACGADVIKPPLTGDATEEILAINHLYHYATFQELIRNKKKIAILGAGLIGCEFANDLSNAGYQVHVISPAAAPLDLLVPPQIGHILQTALEKNGVFFHFNCIAELIQKISKGYCLELSNGNELEVEFILSAVGLKPHIHLAKTADVKTNQGILVNRYLQTSVTDIYAIGDCAEVEGHVLPYIAPILNCARALAATLAGNPTPVKYPAMPVVIKTPAHPIAVCPPPKAMFGNWEIETKNNGTYALFYNENRVLYGFILTQDAVKEREVYAKQLPSLF